MIKPGEANSETTRQNVNNWFQSTLSSRLNDKSSGTILCVMQRLHQLDLSGLLLEAATYDHLSLPAIAIDAEVIPLTRGRSHHRRAGEVLHPAREPLAVLEEVRASMGSASFNAQCQPDPVPAHGNVFKANWLATYDPDATDRNYGVIVQSWDTAIKTGPANDWSACVTAGVYGGDVFILDVWRGRVEFPELKRKAIGLATRFKSKAILIEYKASGQQLLQELRADRSGVARPIGCNPEGDKLNGVSRVSPMVEAGQLYLPSDPPWLADFTSELLSFPNGRHDDQVGALSQLVAWVRQGASFPVSLASPPEMPAPYDPEGGETDPYLWGSDDHCEVDADELWT